jgi:hypothetical protein
MRILEVRGTGGGKQVLYQLQEQYQDDCTSDREHKCNPPSMHNHYGAS